jgi:myo-inositol 2-dehydrogenase/D-chiro-inositol 1-dehydrogenase
MKVAVIGAGRMGRIRVEDLAADARVSRVLVTNRTAERAVELADDFDAAVVGWGDDALLEADAFVITTGTDTHLTHLTQLAPIGRPVLCEKPIALTLADTQTAMDLMASHGTALQIGFQRRFDAGLVALHERVGAGALGTLYSLVLTAHDHQPSAREFIGGSGGIYRDMHVHDFDQIRWLTGEEIVWVHATSTVREHRQYAEFDDADTTAIVGATTGGAVFTITGTRHDPRGHDIRLEVFGTQDSVASGLTHRTPLALLPPREDIAPLTLDGRPYDGFVDRFREAFRAETEAFVSFASGEIDNPCPPDAALESLRVAIACEESVRSGAPVTVADIHTSAH